MALVTGKTMMDRNAIPAVEDTPETGARETVALPAVDRQYTITEGKGVTGEKCGNGPCAAGKTN